MTLPIALPDASPWHWEHPSSFGEGLAAVWVEGDEVYVGAGFGSGPSHLLRFRDGVWGLVGDRLPPINDVWAGTGAEVLAATRDGLRRLGDGLWQDELDVIPVLALSGDETAAVRYALTTDRVHRHDGTGWNAGVNLDPNHQRGDVWCCDQGVAYLVGEHSAILRWDGSWRLETPSPCDTLHALWGAATGEIFAVGASGCTARRNPTNGSWEGLPASTTSSLEGVWGVTANEVYAVGQSTFLRFDGNRWEPVAGAPDASWQALAGDGAHLIALADDGTIGQYRAGQWTFGPPALTDPSQLRSVWCGGTTTLAAGSGGAIRRRASAGWVNVSFPYTHSLTEIWGSSSQQIFAVSKEGAFGFDGTDWAVEDTGGPVDLMTVDGCSATEVYAGGQNTILRFNGIGWEADWSDSGRVEALWCVDGTIHAGLLDGRVLRRETAMQWPEVHIFSAIVWDIWASSADDVWVVGHQNAIAHWNGQRWDEIPINDGESWWSAIAGTGSDDIVVVGPNGSIFHYDGNPSFRFSREPSTTGQILRGVCANTSGEFFAVGDNGLILRRTP